MAVVRRCPGQCARPLVMLAVAGHWSLLSGLRAQGAQSAEQWARVSIISITRDSVNPVIRSKVRYYLNTSARHVPTQVTGEMTIAVDCNFSTNPQ